MGKVGIKSKPISDLLFDNINKIVMVIICFIFIYPIWYTLIMSFNQGADSLRGGIYFWPRVFTLQNYEAVFRNSMIVTSFFVTASRTVLGAGISVFFTAMVAYAFSKKNLKFRKLYMMMGIITLFFDGGLIPTFLLMRSLRLYDNYLIYIFPTMFNFYNLLIFQSFFRGIPDSLEESAKLDGANDVAIFFKIIIPLSAPVLATIALFNGVAQWNDFFTGIIYINNPSLLPIQSFLYKIIAQTQSQEILSFVPSGAKGVKPVTSESIKMATMIITIVPITIVYPFLQKYFVKGVLLGSVKE